MRSIQIAAVALIAPTMAGCSGSGSSGPSGPSAGSTEIRTPTIVSLTPNAGSIYGGGLVTVVGDIAAGATATVGGIAVRLGWPPTDSTDHVFVAPPHAAGPVDLVVTNPGGRSQTAVGAYTYVEAESFRLDGEWGGFTVDGSDAWIEFTVRDQRLTSVRCIDSPGSRFAIELSQPFVNGKVDVVGDAGRFSAWIVSATEAAGTIDMKPCSGGLPWAAALRSSPQQMRR